jgi:hypothetical protein
MVKCLQSFAPGLSNSTQANLAGEGAQTAFHTIHDAGNKVAPAKFIYLVCPS